ncbi:RNA polymerase sigma factor [Candidatus Poribacteria bacterium]|nr:RNA polymerase sigma factor [Candidatus Poribacteria bacterium]
MKQADPRTDEVFVRLMRDHEKAVFALALGRLRNVHDAQDVAQEVFVEAFRNIHKIRDPKKAFAWLFKATTYRCKDRLRKAFRQEKREQEYATVTDSAVAMQFEERSDDGVFDAISLLQEENRVVVMLRYFAGLSYVEISKITGLSKTKIDWRLRTAKKDLRKRLTEMIARGDGT